MKKINRLLCRLFGHKIERKEVFGPTMISKITESCTRKGCGYVYKWTKLWDD